MALVAYITTVGAALISECIGNTLVFTRADLGTGGDQVESNCRARTALAAKAADAGISRVVGSDGSAKVTVQYSNESQTTALSVKEIGIYGKKSGTSAETLICYANFGDTPDVIQPEAAAMFVRLYEIIIAVTGVAALTIQNSYSAYQEVIEAVGLLKGDGQGGVTPAVAGVDYAAANHTHDASAIISGILPIVRGGTGASTAAGALANLGVIYSETEPAYQAGAIWLQPVS